MRLNLDSDQQFFRETTGKFLDELVPVGEVRRLRDEPAGFDPTYWKRGAELGWTSLLLSEEAGGGSISGQGIVDLTLVAHEFGFHAAPGPLLPTNLVALALGRQDPNHELIAGLLSGEAVASWAYAETGGLGEVALQMREDGDDLVLDGLKRPVESAAQASHLLVVGRTGEGLTQVLVPTDATGVTVTPMKSIDLTRRFAAVRFDGVRVPKANVVGTVGGAAADVESQLLHTLVLLAAESVGAMQRAFDLTTEWMFDRYSFGRPLASYQALKHKAADMKMWLEASHGVADEAAEALATGLPSAARLASAAAAYIGQYGTELVQDCVQLHGGIGVTFEHDIHLFMRRQIINRTLYGTPAEHRQRITSLIEQESAA
jgi:alkylation response protein AidB-like acyl-CoA dehydrogenase